MAHHLLATPLPPTNQHPHLINQRKNFPLNPTHMNMELRMNTQVNLYFDASLEKNILFKGHRYLERVVIKKKCTSYMAYKS